jgi:hypothetical protein
MSQTPAGWYPSEGQERYWDGETWTEQTRPLGSGAVPPQPPTYTQQQPYWQPSKKKHTVRNVLLILCGLAILFIGGCAVLFGAALNEADKALDKETENDRPTVVEEGKTFEHDGYSVAGGWSVKPEQFGGATIKGMKVTLEDDQGMAGRAAQFTFRLYNGSEVVTEIECSSNEMQEEETSTIDCFSLDSKKVGKWDTIKVSDMW